MTVRATPPTYGTPLHAFAVSSMLLAALACASASDDTAGPPAVTLSSLALTPASATLAVGAAQQFNVSGVWSDGGTTAPTAEFAATGGTISATGLYTAGASAGSFRVIARHVASGMADTSTITVAAPATLTGLSLTPASASIATGATQQFAVSGTWSDGGVASPPVEFTATGGTVSAAGLYTGGSTAGSFRVIARHVTSGLADTSTVTLTPPTGSLVNECATPGTGWLWCDDFDQDRLASYFEVETDGGVFARVNGVGNGGSFGMRSRWATVGQVSAGALHLALGKTPQSYFRPVDAGTAIRRELYWRVYVRLQPGWVGGGADKLSRALIFASSTTWATAATAPVWSGQGAFVNFISIDPVSGTDAAGVLRSTQYNDFANSRYLGQVYGPTPIFESARAGAWYCVEAHARLNQSGASDGLFEVWVNGTLEAKNEGMNWVGAYSQYGLNAVFVENYWNAGSPAVQERYLDNFVVSTQRIGC